MIVPRFLGLVGIGLFLSSPVLADDASRLETARQIVALTHAADNMKALLPQIIKAVRPMLVQQGADQKTIDTLLQNGETHMRDETGQLVDLSAAVYAQTFSEDDLNSLLAFYKTPAGQHLIEKQVPLMHEMLAIGQRWGQLVAKQVLDDYARQKAGSTTLTP